jgi:hypothetical protein
MTTCPNNKHGCRIREHPDYDNYWYCTTCKRKFVEDPGFPFIIIIVGMFIAVALVLNILPYKKASLNNKENNQPSYQSRQNTSDNGFGYDKSINQVFPTE